MRFRVGQRVRVAARPHEGHHRIPGYLKGRTGSVERLHGAFTNPEARAYGADGLPEQRLYLVAFAERELWPGYRGSGDDCLYADVFEHWLEEVE